MGSTVTVKTLDVAADLVRDSRPSSDAKKQGRNGFPEAYIRASPPFAPSVSDGQLRRLLARRFLALFLIKWSFPSPCTYRFLAFVVKNCHVPGKSQPFSTLYSLFKVRFPPGKNSREPISKYVALGECCGSPTEGGAICNTLSQPKEEGSAAFNLWPRSWSVQKYLENARFQGTCVSNLV